MTKLLLRLAGLTESKIRTPEGRTRCGTLSGVTGIVLNLLLFGFKLFASQITGAVSIMADAFNNLTDSFSSVVSLVSFRLSGKEADDDHPFGHERLEYVSSMIVALIIMMLAWELGSESFDSILHPEKPSKFSIVSGIVLGASVLVKVWMYLFNNKLAKLIDSDLLRATAVDSLSDTISTGAVLVCSIVSPLIGFNLDGYAGLLVALFIAKAGIGIIKDTADSIIGTKPDPQLTESIKKYITEFDGALDVHDMILHQYGANRAFLSVHVEVDGRADLFKSHDMIDNIEVGIMKKFGIMATIHMDPISPEDEFVLSLKEYTANAVKNIDERLSIHDFRVVHGDTHTNLIFDVTKPYSVKMKDEEIVGAVSEKIKELNKNYFAVVQVDREFT